MFLAYKTSLFGRERWHKCMVRETVSLYLHSPVHGEEIQSVWERNKESRVIYKKDRSPKEQVTERFTDTHWRLELPWSTFDLWTVASVKVLVYKEGKGTWEGRMYELQHTWNPGIHGKQNKMYLKQAAISLAKLNHHSTIIHIHLHT